MATKPLHYCSLDCPLDCARDKPLGAWLGTGAALTTGTPAIAMWIGLQDMRPALSREPASWSFVVHQRAFVGSPAATPGSFARPKWNGGHSELWLAPQAPPARKNALPNTRSLRRFRQSHEYTHVGPLSDRVLLDTVFRPRATQDTPRCQCKLQNVWKVLLCFSYLNPAEEVSI